VLAMVVVTVNKTNEWRVLIATSDKKINTFLVIDTKTVGC